MTHTRSRRIAAPLALGLALGLGSAVLAGCNEQEQARPIRLEVVHPDKGAYKGVYHGAADTALMPEQVRALQERSTSQRF